MQYIILSQISIAETSTCIHHWQLDLKKNELTNKTLERRSKKNYLFSYPAIRPY